MKPGMKGSLGFVHGLHLDEAAQIVLVGELVLGCPLSLLLVVGEHFAKGEGLELSL